MRVVVIYRPREAPPLEQLPNLLQGMAEWLERYRDRLEVLEFFPEGGGLGIGDVEHSSELLQMAAEHPFTDFMDVEVRAVVHADAAMRIYQDVFGAQAGG